MKPIRLFWWRHPDPAITNVGDAINPHIVEIISGRRVQYQPVDRCDLIAIGSIMEIAVQTPRHKPLNVWGAGFISDGEPVACKYLRCAALRGPRSAECVSDGEDAALGDPGLFADLLLKKKPHKRFDIGIIPHYVDLDLEVIVALRATQGSHTVISPLLQPTEFIAAVAECSVIVSSSLHGLVTADALCVPNHWIELSDNVIGRGHKFRDYLAVFGIEGVAPIRITRVDQINDALVNEIGGVYGRPNIDAIRKRLADSFPQFD